MDPRTLLLSHCLLLTLALGLAPGSSAGSDTLLRPHWDREGRDWPHRDSSTFVQASGLRWHVQRLGRGPAVVLIHGTGASTHSWRDLASLLARRHTVIALDLPGHGFTDPLPPDRLSLPGMASAIGTLLRAIDIQPELVIGHSAGAAILARMCLDHWIDPKTLMSLNGALLPLHGLPGRFFAPAAKLLATNTLVSRLFAWRAKDRTAVEQLLDGTGSTLDPWGIELYARLVRTPGHVAGALAMMANWDLHPLQQDLPALRTNLVLVVGEGDRTIHPSQAQQVAALVPGASVIPLHGLGHLAHEERPASIDEIVQGLTQTTAISVNP